MLNDSTMSLTVSIYNPGTLKKEDLVRGFIVRQDLLQRLVEDLRREGREGMPQHQLLIGQRGLGKTTLLRRLGYAVEDDAELDQIWVPLAFPEEQYNISGLGDFWLNCVDALSDALERRGESRASERLDTRVEAVPKTGGKRAPEALKILLDEADRLNRRFLLLVDNFDLVLDRLPREQEWEFRRVLQEERRLHIIGASSRFLEAVYEHGRAFYDFFQIHELRGLDDEELFSLLRHLAKESGKQAIEDLLQNRKARIRTLRVLTGGNPRTALLLFRILAEGPEADVQRDVEQLLDLYTPLYKARFEELATQAQQVVDAMAIHWDPLTAGELAELLRLPVSQVSAQLKRLEDFGVVEKTPWFGEKKAAFQIAERFFNIWYLMRASRRLRRRLIWLVKFLEAWFDQQELSARARGFLASNPEAMGRERYAEMALAYSQAVTDRYLRRSLESAGLHAAIDEGMRQLVDFSDLPEELHDKAQRIQKVRELKDRVCRLGIDWDGIDPKDFWRVLGGSPNLSLAEKERVVEQVPALDGHGLHEMYERLKAAENEPFKLFEGTQEEQQRLYEALAAGDIEDVYDYEETSAVGDRWGLPALPVLAIASRIFVDGLPVEELQRAEVALRALTRQPELEAGAWFGLGCLLGWRLGRGEEAAEAFRRALAIQPNIANGWASLGLVLQRFEKYHEAETAYRRAIEVDANNAMAWRRLGELYARVRRDEEAEHAYNEAVSFDPSNPTVFKALGAVLIQLNRYEDAQAAYLQASELDRNDGDTWFQIGMVNVLRKNSTEAEAAFRRALELNPQNSLSWWGLSVALTGLDRIQEAAETFLCALSAPDTPQQMSTVLLELANRLPSQENLPLVIQVLQRGVEVFPGNTDLRLALAGVLIRSSRWVEARLIIEEIARGESDFVWPKLLRDVVQAGRVADMLHVLEETGADQRWRPAYEALKASQAGSADYLHRIAPEVRNVALDVLREIDPELFPKPEVVASE